MKSNNKIYIILSVFTATSLFLVVFCVFPLLKDIRKNSKELISAKNNIVTLDAQAKETEKLKNNYETYKLNLERIDNLFVDPANPVDFIKFLENTAVRSQVALQMSLPYSSQGAPKTSSGAIIFQITVKGDFSSVLDFAKKVEMGPYLVEIESLTIRNSETLLKDYSDRNVEAGFTIKAFTKK